jgi:hypothetical protein
MAVPPYLRDGKPVATETNIVISFLSNDAISMTFPPSIPVTGLTSQSH